MNRPAPSPEEESALEELAPILINSYMLTISDEENPS